MDAKGKYLCQSGSSLQQLHRPRFQKSEKQSLATKGVGITKIVNEYLGKYYLTRFPIQDNLALLKRSKPSKLLLQIPS